MTCANDSLFWLAIALVAIVMLLSWVGLTYAIERERELEHENRKLKRDLGNAEAELELTRMWHA